MWILINKQFFKHTLFRIMLITFGVYYEYSIVIKYFYPIYRGGGPFLTYFPFARAGEGVPLRIQNFPCRSWISGRNGLEENVIQKALLSTLKSLHAEMKVEPIDDTSSDISMSMDFVVKGK